MFQTGKIRKDFVVGLVGLNPFTQVYVSNLSSVKKMATSQISLNPFTQVYVSNTG